MKSRFLLLLLIPFIQFYSQTIIDKSEDFQWTNKIFEINFESVLKCKPVIWNNKIFIADSSGLITCIDTSGAEIWNHNIYGTVAHSPAVADGFIAIPTNEGELITLNRENGEQIQSLIFDEPITTDILVFNYSGSKQLMIPKQSDSKAVVLFATGTGKISCYDLETLEMIWEDNSSKKIIGYKLIYKNNKVIYSCSDGYLYCVDANAGWLIWKWKMSGDHSKPIEIFCSDNEIFLMSSDGILYSIDSQLGSLIWKNSTNKLKEPAGLTNDGRMIVAPGKKDKFYFISESNGKNQKSVELKLKDDRATASLLGIRETVLIPTRNGVVYAVDSKYKISSLLKLGEKINSLQYIEKNKFLISTIEGKILLFFL
ncbi:MAG: PQQ-binding-like beta-propeller repeat protein [bacterium]